MDVVVRAERVGAGREMRGGKRSVWVVRERKEEENETRRTCAKTERDLDRTRVADEVVWRVERSWRR